MMCSLAIVFGVACLPWFHPDAIVGVKWWWYAPFGFLVFLLAWFWSRMNWSEVDKSNNVKKS